MTPRILLVYPNLPLMMAPAMSMGIFNAIAKRKGCEVQLFETTQYSEQYNNRHIRMTEIGANRQNKKDELEDMFWIKDPKNIISDFQKTVDEFEPDLILMSVQEDVWRTATILLDSIQDKHIPHIIGGTFPTTSPDTVIEYPSVTALARHEGEYTVEHAIDAVRKGNTFGDIPGLWIKQRDGSIKKTRPAELCDINKTIPDYDCFKGTRWRRPMGGRIFERAVSMETYRGCPYNCTYCNSPGTRNMAKIFGVGNFMRRKTIDQVERELNHYQEIYDPDLIMFIDDSFLARPQEEIFDFCKMWKKYRVPFWFNTRIENCKPDVLDTLKEAGVYRMTFGIESGNEEYRRSVLKRSASNAAYDKHLGYINDSNIPYSLNVIIGMPFETRDMVLDTARMVHRARGYDGLTISMFQPYQGTELHKLAVDNGFMPADHINGWHSQELGGGYLDSWILRMPDPYLQLADVDGLIKTFALYAYYDESRWPDIHRAETDSKLYEQLMIEFKSEFFGDIQQGGRTRIERFCAMHDSSSTYKFSSN